MGSSRVGRIYIFFRGHRVFVHDELFDLDYVAPNGLTNRELMKMGKAPYAKDGKKLNLHHINQDPEGDLEEILQNVHQQSTKELHPFRNQPSRINRNEFGKYRQAYWKYRLTRYMGDTE